MRRRLHFGGVGGGIIIVLPLMFVAGFLIWSGGVDTPNSSTVEQRAAQEDTRAESNTRSEPDLAPGSGLSSGFLLGALLSLGGVFVTQFFTDRREERRSNEEREREELRIENERQKWLRQERRQAYGRLLALTESIDPTQPWEFVDLTAVGTEIAFLTSSRVVSASADTVVSQYSEVRRKARELHQSGEAPAQNDTWKADFEEALLRRRDFMRLAREELGVDPLA